MTGVNPKGLSPCPFCGGGAKVEAGAPNGFFVAHRCGWGGFASEMFGYRCTTETEAIAAWNRRALTPLKGAPAVTEVREAVIVAAMKQSFRDVVAGHSDKLFEDTGVMMPADHVWERYAKAALVALSPTAPELGAVKGWRPTHRHVKRGSKYRFDGYAEIQTDAPLTDYAKVVIYSAEDGCVWVRPVGEFADGRFVVIDSAAQNAEPQTDEMQPDTYTGGDFNGVVRGKRP